MKRAALLLLLAGFCTKKVCAQGAFYKETPYAQDYSVKYYLADSSNRVSDLQIDRNGIVSVLSSQGIMRPQGGAFQYPGALQFDKSYKPVADRQILRQATYQNQLVYLDSAGVFSNAFAGRWFVRHGVSKPTIFCTAPDFSSLVSDGTLVRVFIKDSLISEIKFSGDEMRDIKFDITGNQFLILGKNSISSFSLRNQKIISRLKSPDLTCFDVTETEIVVGTSNGYFSLDKKTFRTVKQLTNKLPVSDLTTISAIDSNLWFGSSKGAFMRKTDGKFNYYFGERWLPGNDVLKIIKGEQNQVLVLTSKGIGAIHFDLMTLEEKALIYEKQVRLRHIRYGFNCDVTTLKHGDLSTSEMHQRESDNLWTSMYLASQLFRYKVTGSKEALQNCMESFDAMERLFDITGMKGYFARGFERRGHFQLGSKQVEGGMTNGWVQPKNSEWDWRGTTSSDQTVGQMFSLTLLAEYMDGEVKQRAINLMDKLMTNIIENDWYLIDFDGKPTLWGKWNPDYVNGFPVNVGDRKLNSSNIIGFLQAAFHFTGKEIYKQKAYELMNKHGYLENLLRPMTQIGQAENGAGDWAKMLSEGWNHSDDEMYFLAYWCLYPHAFDAKLKEKYKIAIQQHWQLERPEKDGLWNLCYAMTGAREFDLNETIWYLKEFPLDMIEWQVANSHRKDLSFVTPNFRGQTTSEVLPPDERPELKHNRNLFKLDRETNGNSELSAGDSFLLPYWMGRFLGAIRK